MFSDQVKKAGKLPAMPLFMGVAGLVFFSLVAALVVVVNGQVDKARIRQAQYDAAQTAIADCSTSYSGAARRQCIEQVNVALTPYSTYTPELETMSSTQKSQASQVALQDKTDSQSTSGAHGFMRAAFSRQ